MKFNIGSLSLNPRKLTTNPLKRVFIFHQRRKIILANTIIIDLKNVVPINQKCSAEPLRLLDSNLAKGHIKAVEKVLSTKDIDAYNLGTGIGYSVLDIVKAFERVNNVKINYKIVGRRAGDIAACYADPSYAEEKLGWKAERGLDKMCEDSYNFILKQHFDGEYHKEEEYEDPFI